MTIQIIRSYCQKFQTRYNRPPNILVHEHKNSIKDVVKAYGIIVKDNPDIVIYAYNNLDVSKNNLLETWNKLTYWGWMVFANTNIDLVKKFRKDNRITSNLINLDDWVFFQKEDYSKRIDVAPPSIVEKIQMQTSIPETVPVPNWNDSHLKIEYLMKYGQKDYFIETGTYLGQTVELVRRSSIPFKKIISMDINYQMAANAKKYFDFDDRIEILYGDSVDKLGEICDTYDLESGKPILAIANATFWLDAHASGPLPGGKSGGSPLLEELKWIKSTGNPNHTIMIDDKRLFGSSEWSGIQLEKAMELIREINPDYQIYYLDGQVPNDIICCTVKNDDLPNIDENVLLVEEIGV